ncbi:MAG: glycosyltransferase [Fervidobacterium sp.]
MGGSVVEDEYGEYVRNFLESHPEYKGRLFFLGFRKDAMELMAEWEVFVLSTVYEGLPLSVMEALTAGEPVIASSVSGLPELVDDGKTGILVEKGNVEELEKAMVRLIENRELIKEMGIKGQEKALKHFDVSHMVERYAKLCDVMLK